MTHLFSEMPETLPKLYTGIQELYKSRHKTSIKILILELVSVFLTGSYLILTNQTPNLLFWSPTAIIGLSFVGIHASYDIKINNWNLMARSVETHIREQQRQQDHQTREQAMPAPNGEIYIQPQLFEEPKKTKRTPRSKNQIKTDISKLSEKKRKELFKEMFQEYNSIPEETDNNDRWSDMEILSDEDEVVNEIETE